MFIIDDLLLRTVGITLKPFDMIWMLELLRNYALQEKYNIEKIGNKIKENRLLFEIGEITKEDYEEKNELLLEERNRAEEIMASLSEDMKIQEL
ncbi:MAG: hypothetical protein AABX04_03280 [Nanoarchaeota archaeon]